MKSIVLFLLLAFLFAPTAKAQITRGAVSGELFISGEWYVENNSNLHYAIFHSYDNGKNISLKYENIETPPPSEMTVGKVIGDATPGALYNYGNNKLWVSFDYGVSWQFMDGPFSMLYYFSGFANGEVFKTWTNESLWQVELYRSENFGLSFELINESIDVGLLEVGNFDGEIYGLSGSAGTGYNLHFSTNYGVSFIETPIDSTVAFWAPSGQFPEISRGTAPGEIYLVSWTPELHYKIFYSVDTGNTWIEKYESDYIDIYYWGLQFTAGREPGSFYVMRARINPEGDHVWLYIDYSHDYGKTFTTFFHDLDSTITGTITHVSDNIELSNYPNPFTDYTTISFDVSENYRNPMLNIYDIYGKPIRNFNISGKKTQIWDGTNFNGIKVKDGFYLYNISCENYFSKFNKLLIID
ncbi:MAG: T9SS type A sorting domain-containing protein [Lentimicrobiaceae bacterium]|nr:T9SS type A sorting domain-containing protein [Lentimicrobiaceae bacterium]